MIPANVRGEDRDHFMEILSRITEKIAPEKIICFGSRTMYRESWNNFLPQGIAHAYTYYDLLVITKKEDKRKDREIFQVIDMFNSGLHINAVSHNITYVNKAILKGHRFFVTICKKGVVMYESTNIPLAIPGPELGEKKYARRAVKSWERLFNLAKQYYRIARKYTGSDSNEVSALMYHQAVEFACRAMIKYHTGYRPVTHDIERLVSLLGNFTREKIDKFSHLDEYSHIQVLFNAYRVVRLREDCKVYHTELSTIELRVGQFIALIERLYGVHRRSLQNSTD